MNTQPEPQQVAHVTDLDSFGVKTPDLTGETIYLEYTPRDDDIRLMEALVEAIESRWILLVVRGSAAATSRSAAEATHQKPAHPCAASSWSECRAQVLSHRHSGGWMNFGT